jgi:ABC-2 type transport system permease protein
MSTTHPSAGRPTSMWRIVAGREISTQVRSRGFQVSVGALLAGLVVMVVILSLVSGREQTDKIAVVDDTAAAAVADGSAVAERISENTSLEAESYDDTAAAEKAVEDGDVEAALLPTSDGYELVGDDSVDATVSQALTLAVSQSATQANAAEQGVDLTALAAGTDVPQRLLDPDAEDAGLRQVASFVFVFLFYITALTFGMSLATSVVQEKESRVVEILAAAVPIRALLWGKIAGASVLAIGQTVLLAVVGVAALLISGNGHALSVLGPAIIWYVVFFVIGFVALASLWSVAGSLAGRQQDIGGTTAPLQIILFAPYIIAVTAGEQVQTIVSMLPIVSTMLMPSRLAQGDVPLWQLGVAIVVTVATAILLVRVGARIYEQTLLRTGRRISFSEALKAKQPADQAA